MARNYGKRTRRYAVGGIVPREKDKPREDLTEEYRDYRELELPQNRNFWREQNPEGTGDVDVSPEDYLVPEDRDT